MEYVLNPQQFAGLLHHDKTVQPPNFATPDLKSERHPIAEIKGLAHLLAPHADRKNEPIV